MTTVQELIAKHRKVLTAVAGGVVLVVGELAGVESEAYTVAVAVLTALGVYALPNRGVHG